ncbi:hypothetical protein ScPMuIL_008106 [Solemya velum]
MNQEFTVRARGKTSVDKYSQQEKMEDKEQTTNSEQTLSDSKQSLPETHGSNGYSIRTIVFVTHFNIFLYSTCFWIQLGTLPYLSKKLGVDPVMFGYLQTTFAVVQLMGGPLYGRFGDLFGCRAAMMLAFIASSTTYLLLAFANSIPLLFISRLPSIFMHAMQGGQMIVTDVVDTSDRAGALGKLGVSYGIGMVIGPFIGGLVTKFLGEQTAAFASFSGSVLSILLVLRFIPTHTKHVHPSESSGQSVFDVKKFLSIIVAPGALFLLGIRIAAGIPIGVFQSMFSVVALETFKLPADQNGYLMSYIGILTMIVQGVGVGVLTKKYSENSILKWAAFILTWAYLLLAYVTDILQLCLVCVPLVMGLASKNIVISSGLTRTVSDADTGAMLGLNMAVNSLIRSVSPTIGGIMLSKFGFASFGYLGFVMTGLVTCIIFLKLRD